MYDLLYSGWEEGVDDGGLWDDSAAGAAALDYTEEHSGNACLKFTLTGTSIEYLSTVATWSTNSYASVWVKFDYRLGVEDMDGGLVLVAALYDGVSAVTPLQAQGVFTADDYQIRFLDELGAVVGTSAALAYGEWHEVRMSCEGTGAPYLNNGYVNGVQVVTNAESTEKATSMYVGGITMLACTGSQYLDTVTVDSEGWVGEPPSVEKAMVSWSSSQFLTATKLNEMVTDTIRRGVMVWHNMGWRQAPYYPGFDGSNTGQLNLQDIGNFQLSFYDLPFDTLFFEGFVVANPYTPGTTPYAFVEVSFDTGASWAAIHNEPGWDDHSTGCPMSVVRAWTAQNVTNGTTTRTRFRVNLKTGTIIKRSSSALYIGKAEPRQCSVRIRYIGDYYGTAGDYRANAIAWNYRAFLYHSDYNFGADVTPPTS